MNLRPCSGSFILQGRVVYYGSNLSGWGGSSLISGYGYPYTTAIGVNVVDTNYLAFNVWTSQNHTFLTGMPFSTWSSIRMAFKSSVPMHGGKLFFEGLGFTWMDYENPKP